MGRLIGTESKLERKKESKHLHSKLRKRYCSTQAVLGLLNYNPPPPPPRPTPLTNYLNRNLNRNLKLET